MIDALTVASHMLSDDAQRLSTISHNLANVSTTGFKRQRTVTIPFQEHLALQSESARALIQASLPGHTTQTDTRPGTLRVTGQPLDLAIEDDGFFEVETPQGPAYTRRGDFRLDAQGTLVTQNGLPIMGTGGQIRLSTTEPVIDRNGVILEKGQQVGQVKIVRFANPETLSQSGNGLFAITPDTQMETTGISTVRQGHLESSNVTSMEEMVRLIETMRHFETAQKLVQGYDDMMDKALKKFGDF